MWIWRRLLKISWRDKISNEEVLRRVGEGRQLIKTITTRKKNWIGHVMRGNRGIQETIEGHINGNRRKGRPRTGILNEIQEDTYMKMKRRTEDRKEWKKWTRRGI